MRSSSLAVAALVSAGAARALLAVPSSSESIQYSPTGSWDVIAAPGAYEDDAEFLLSNHDQGIILITFPGESTCIQYLIH